MKQILVLGAGLSATSLINYLLKQAEIYDWFIELADIDENLAYTKIKAHPRGRAQAFDVADSAAIERLLDKKDVVVSLLPARFHDSIAVACLQKGIHMATASYVSPALKLMEKEIEAKNLIFLNELGVDPGIDHMSAMRVIDRIRQKGGHLASFYSFTGGLIAPESDNNPWHYKFTWNPRNVVVAGQGVSHFIKNGKHKQIPYHQLFNRIMEREVLDYGKFEIYPNRDSMKYRKIYQLDNIPTIFRGTMRRPGYAAAWNVFVQLGCTDDTYVIEESENMTYREFVNTFLRYDPGKPVEEKLVDYLNLDPDGEVMQKLKWLGIFDNRKIELKNATPAQILQKLLTEKWALDPDDKDMIVMQHEFEYELENTMYQITSSMVYIGKSATETAMATAVGTPLAIAVKLLLTDQIQQKGVIIPTKPELYNPILDELETYGIKFVEKELII
ncbi:MAG: saccharopine dehydrogenase NADP-binding domain-containing protein [Bacteroidales bacterium]|nr:saccharopine dehydrogenase NADP-binding domain-containing protein [Bacteroidales bacterium]